jgi:hypothetical protein
LTVLRLSQWLGLPIWNICVANDHGYFPPVISTSRSCPHSWFIPGFVTRLTWRVPLVKHELLTLPEHLSSPPGINGVRVSRSFVLYVLFCRSVVCPFSFVHCVLCPSIYGFWLPFGILKLFLYRWNHIAGCVIIKVGT